MTADPYFSVVINAYNYGRYIEEAIDSVLAQTFPQDEIEVIVVDDGSTDDTSVRIKKYTDRICYIYKENGGQASALNAGLLPAKGEIIAFLDADDFWHPSKLLEISREFRRSPSVDFVYHYMDVIDDNSLFIDRHIFPVPAAHGYLEKYLGGRLPWFSPMSGMAVRSDCLRKLMPLPEDFRLAADLYLHYLLPFFIRELSLVRKPLGYYRLHGGNLSGGNLLTAEKLGREKNIILLISGHVERQARKLGHDAHLLIRRMKSVAKAYDIRILGVEGQKIAAVRRALLFDGFLPDDSVARRFAGRFTLSVSALVPPSTQLWLQRIYRRIWNILGRVFLL